MENSHSPWTENAGARQFPQNLVSSVGLPVQSPQGTLRLKPLIRLNWRAFVRGKRHWERAALAAHLKSRASIRTNMRS
jgi:hypothetical protein